MATAAKKTTPARRAVGAPPPRPSVTNINDPARVVQETEGVKIHLGLPDPEGEKVTVIIPKAFRLKRDDGTETEFKPGVQEILEVDASHWWATANGVKVYQPDDAES
jgi:hypothetical protein